MRHHVATSVALFAMALLGEVSGCAGAISNPGTDSGPGNTTCDPIKANTAWKLDDAHTCVELQTADLPGVCLRNSSGGDNSTMCLVGPDGSLYSLACKSDQVAQGVGWTYMLYGGSGTVTSADAKRCTHLFTVGGKCNTSTTDAGP